MKTPLAIVKEKFGDKAKLVAAVEKFTSEDLWVSRTNQDKGLQHVSNAKLLRLHDTFAKVKEKFGTRDKLIDAILTLEKRAKDDGYRSRLSAYPVPRLFDLYNATEKRVARAKARPAASKAATKTPRTRKAKSMAAQKGKK